ncbi:hypothetical protein [Pseudomonas caspiana]|uniref:hypothetical protein n=1 Tax=Pseudomonas caspiana TaxID=1451454 RepID=UPI0032EE1DC0
MLPVKILAALAYLPVIATLLIRYAEKKYLIIYAPKIRINYSFASISSCELYCAAIWLGYICFVILASAKKFLFDEFDITILSIGPIFIIMTGTIALVDEQYKLIAAYKENSVIIKTILIALAICIGYMASAMTDASIADFTSTNASNFPDAQKVITLIATVGIWAYIAVACSLAVYVVISILAFIKIMALDKTFSQNKQPKKNFLGAKWEDPHSQKMEILILASIIIGFTMTIIAPLEYVQLIRKDETNKILKVLLVETSFHLNPEICGFTAPPGSVMTMLPFKQAVIATPDKKSTYNFIVIECNRKFSSIDQSEKSLTSSKQ